MASTSTSQLLEMFLEAADNHSGASDHLESQKKKHENLVASLLINEKYFSAEGVDPILESSKKVAEFEQMRGKIEQRLEDLSDQIVERLKLLNGRPIIHIRPDSQEKYKFSLDEEGHLGWTNI